MLGYKNGNIENNLLNILFFKLGQAKLQFNYMSTVTDPGFDLRGVGQKIIECVEGLRKSHFQRVSAILLLKVCLKLIEASEEKNEKNQRFGHKKNHRSAARPWNAASGLYTVCFYFVDKVMLVKSVFYCSEICKYFLNK